MALMDRHMGLRYMLQPKLPLLYELRVRLAQPLRAVQHQFEQRASGSLCLGLLPG